MNIRTSSLRDTSYESFKKLHFVHSFRIFLGRKPLTQLLSSALTVFGIAFLVHSVHNSLFQSSSYRVMLPLSPISVSFSHHLLKISGSDHHFNVATMLGHIQCPSFKSTLNSTSRRWISILSRHKVLSIPYRPSTFRFCLIKHQFPISLWTLTAPNLERIELS